MILERTIAPVFAANCYVLAPAPAGPALVVDPGAGSVRGAMALLRSNRLALGAILLTHGHADHVWDTAALIEAARAEDMLAIADPLAPEASVPVYVPQPDLHRLDDPDASTAISANGMGFADMAGTAWRRPADVRAFPAEGFGAAFEILPGLGLQAIPAPGHTEGSTLFFFNSRLADNYLLTEAEVIDDNPGHADEEHDYLMALAGDVIFKGSVGRTDLPGGDQVQMWATLRLLASAVSPETILLPGHGAVTTMEHEHHGNPYLAEAKIRGGDRNA
ncbi:MBL fold metallo-hydrolase [Actinomyces gaoshouyii]|uniref:MBL fold metallo-hydrolase n=1 Tax=Actinomyces gaoshouyii TaxID=1960083 RepID=UPI0009BFD7C5|nr:MBL fold metallo-hydrolase [Actinomyces gaoshouyii]ARD41638.1 hydrolase [Actinomyces gaoshouyii]